eukprot:scaffold3031_cov116-Skeletonema_dohrnii-CCMP3373.AAC.2
MMVAAFHRGRLYPRHILVLLVHANISAATLHFQRYYMYPIVNSTMIRVVNLSLRNCSYGGRRWKGDAMEDEVHVASPLKVGSPRTKSSATDKSLSHPPAPTTDHHTGSEPT